MSFSKKVFRNSLVTFVSVLSTISLNSFALGKHHASVQNRVTFGTLKCEVDGGVNFVIGSKRKLHCVFKNTQGKSSAYVGEIKKWGVSLGATTSGIFLWTVLGSSSSLPASELTGTYVGRSADVAVGLGVGVNVLIGGSKNNLILQPLSVEGETGLELTVSVVSALTLKPLFKTKEVQNVVFGKAKVDRHYGCGSYAVVQKGDTLSRIAEICGVTVEGLLKANSKIENVRELRVGERVRIPVQTGNHTRSPCAEKEILKPNERVISLARRCGVTLHALIVANPGIDSIDQIKPGLVFNIPPYL